MRNLIFTILILTVSIFNFPIQAQSVKVSVQLSGEDQHSGISIHLLRQSSGNLADYCVTGEDGSCEFTDVQSGSYEIKVKYFGYKDTTHLFDISEGSELFFQFELNPISFNLPNISVIDKIIGLRRRGDTLDYNIKAYTTGKENTLGDILKLLPGMEVDNEGNVLVRNKKVDELLLEGKELVNEQHKLATEGLQADVIYRIELIENYRKKKELFRGESENEKVAVNVLLKEDAKGNLKGNGQLLGGYPKYISTALNLFRVTKKSGYSLFFRQNNTGEPPLDKPLSLLLEEISTPSNWQKLMRLEKIAFSNDLKSVTNKNDGLVQNDDYHFAFNGDEYLSQKLNNKIYITGSLANRISESYFERTYYDQFVTEVTDIRDQKAFSYLYGRNQTSMQWDQSQFTELTLPVQVLSSNETYTENGSFALSEFQQQSQPKRNSFNFQPQLEHLYKMKNHMVLTFLQELSLKEQNEEISLNSNDPFLGIPKNDSINKYQIKQNLSYHQFNSTTSLELRKNWGKSFLLWKGEVNFEKEELTAKLDSTLIKMGNGDQTLNSSSFQHSLQGRKDFGNGRVILTLNHAWLKQEPEKGRSNANQYLLPYLSFIYEYSATNAFSVSYSESLDFPALMNYFSFNKIRGPRTLSTGNLDLEVLRHTSSYSISLFTIALSEAPVWYNLSLSYNMIKSSFITNSIIQPNYVLNEFIKVPEIDNISVHGWITKYFDKWSLIFKSTTNFESGYTSRGGEIQPLHRLQSNSSLSIRSKRWKNWEAALKINQTYLHQTFDDIENGFQNWDFSLENKYQVSNWSFNMDLTYNFQRASFTNSNLTILDAGIAYVRNSKWKFFLKGNNLLNLQSITFIDVNYLPNYVEFINYPTFPGQVLIGAGYYF